MAPGMIVSIALAARAVLAWSVWRRDRAYAPIAIWTSALMLGWVAHATVELAGIQVRTVESLRVAAAALGLWAVSRAVMEQRAARVPLVLASLLIGASLAPWIGDEAADWMQDGAWVLGVAGAWWWIQHALLRERAIEPRLAHFVVLVYATLGTVSLTLDHASGWTRTTPALFATGAALIGEARWLADRAWRRATHVGDRDEQLRPPERVGDLVDLAQAVRGRTGHGASASRDAREP